MTEKFWIHSLHSQRYIAFHSYINFYTICHLSKLEGQNSQKYHKLIMKNKAQRSGIRLDKLSLLLVHFVVEKGEHAKHFHPTVSSLLNHKKNNHNYSLDKIWKKTLLIEPCRNIGFNVVIFLLTHSPKFSHFSLLNLWIAFLEYENLNFFAVMKCMLLQNVQYFANQALQ